MYACTHIVYIIHIYNYLNIKDPASTVMDFKFLLVIYSYIINHLLKLY